MDPNAKPADPGKVFLVDKPLGWTSFDVVKRIRGQLKIKKIGHAGTLDPLATGLLILCSGKKTKEIEKYQGQEKEYIGEFLIGETTPSFDKETEVDNVKDINHIKKENIDHASESLKGEIQQVPPAFSAVKVDGKRAYKSARAGEEIKLKAKPIQIKAFDITSIDLPIVRFKIICSKGTYIRSIARDFGEFLGVGAHLASLRRTRIGNFHVQDAKSIDQIIKDEHLSRN